MTPEDGSPRLPPPPPDPPRFDPPAWGDNAEQPRARPRPERDGWWDAPEAPPPPRPRRARPDGWEAPGTTVLPREGTRRRTPELPPALPSQATTTPSGATPPSSAEPSSETAPAGGMGGGAAKTAAISFVGAVGAAVLGFALTVVVTRGLGASGAGMFFTITAIFFVLSNAMELGADTGLLWAVPRLKAHRRFADIRTTLIVGLNPVWIASALTGLVVFVAAEPLSGWFFTDEQAETGAQLLRIMSPALVVAAPLTVALAGTRGLGSVLAFTGITNIGVPLARPLLILAALGAGLSFSDTIQAVIAAWSLPLALATAAAFVLLVRGLRAVEDRARNSGRPVKDARPRKAVSGEFWAYCRPRAVSALLEIALVWTDVLLVSAIAGPRVAGIYAAASRFVTTGTLAEAAMRVALSPRLSELLALGNIATAGKLIGTASVWITAVSWPLYFTLATFSPYVLRLFRDEFAEGATALTILSLAMAVSMTAGNVQTVLLMSGRSAWQLGNKAAALTVDIVLCIVLIPPFGMVGAAIAWASAILLDTALAVVQVRYRLNIRAYEVRRGKRGRVDWRSEVSALHANRGLLVQRLAEAVRGQHRDTGAALAMATRQRAGLLPVGAAAVGTYGVLGVVFRVVTDASAVGFWSYLLVATVLYAGLLWWMRAIFDLDTVLAGMKKKRSAG